MHLQKYILWAILLTMVAVGLPQISLGQDAPRTKKELRKEKRRMKKARKWPVTWWPR